MQIPSGWEMFIRVGRVLFFWVWHVDELSKWGVALSSRQAKADALKIIRAHRPELAAAAIRSADEYDWEPVPPKQRRRSWY